MSYNAPTTKRDLRQEITDNIIAALERGVAPWQKPWQAGAFEMPMNPTTGTGLVVGRARRGPALEGSRAPLRHGPPVSPSPMTARVRSGA